MNNTITNILGLFSMLCLFIAFIMALLNLNTKKDITKDFIENCKGRVEATLYVGGLNDNLELKCLDAQWY